MLIAGMALTALAGTGILVVGILYLTIPRAMALNFGLPSIPPLEATEWLRLKGIRDLTTGIVAGVLIFTAPALVLGWVVAAFALIPLGDAFTILRANGSRKAAFGIHGATAAGMLAASVLLLVSS